MRCRPLPTVDVTDSAALHTLEQAVTAAPYVAALAPEGLDALTLCDGKACLCARVGAAWR